MNYCRLSLLSVTLTFALIAAVLMARGNAGVSEQSQVIYKLDGYGIHRLDLQLKRQATSIDDRGIWIAEMSVSPADTLIALLITERGVIPPGANNYAIPPRNWLRIIDSAGNPVIDLERNIRRLSWSPDGMALAFIEGEFREAGYGFRPMGSGTLSLHDGSVTVIGSLPSGHSASQPIAVGHHINWARHDSNIYIQKYAREDTVYRYSTASGQVDVVALLGIDFSPDGRYYRQQQADVGEGGMNIYMSNTNEDITPRLVERFGPDWSRVALNWVFDRGSCLHVVRQELVQTAAGGRDTPVVVNVLYDVAADKVMREITMPVSPWTAGPDKLVLEKDGQFEILTYEDVYGQ